MAAKQPGQHTATNPFAPATAQDFLDPLTDLLDGGGADGVQHLS
jgi:hypothetical protein